MESTDKAVATQQQQAPAKVEKEKKPQPPLAVGVVPQSMEDVYRLAQYISRSELAPKDYRGKVDNCVAAIMMGADLGLKPMQAVRYIAVINGRPSIWGDGLLAIVMNHRDFQGIREDFEPPGASLEETTAVCKVVRRGVGEIVRTFSFADAKRAKLSTKEGTWQQYPMRMLQMRARGFACRDAFPDALIGLDVGEIAQDAQEPKVLGPDDVEVHDPAAELESRGDFREHAEDAGTSGSESGPGSSTEDPPASLVPEEATPAGLSNEDMTKIQDMMRGFKTLPELERYLDLGKDTWLQNATDMQHEALSTLSGALKAKFNRAKK